MNEPQLSVDMEKNLIKEIDYLLFEYKQDNDKSRIDNVLELVDKILATALEEERAKVLREVAIKIKTYFGYLSNDGVTGKPMDIPLSMMEFDLLSFLSEVKTAKLNQLKEGK